MPFKIKNKNKAIRYSITVEGLLHQNSSIDRTYDMMEAIKFRLLFYRH